MKNKLAGLLLFVFFVSTASAQESVKINFAFKPNTIYHLSTDIVSDNLVSYESDSSGGINAHQPMKSSTAQNISNEIETGNMNHDSSFTVKMKIGKYNMKMMMNGKKMNNNSADYLKTMEIKGLYHPDNSFSNVVIEGKNFPDYLKGTFSKMLENIFKKFTFPKEPVKVGGSFSHEFPMQIPIPTAGQMNMKVLSKYTLEKIEKGNAFFKVKSQLVISQNDPKLIIDAHGEGDGSLIFNMKDNFYHEYDTDMNMIMKINAKGVKMTVKSESKSKMKCELN